MKKWLLLILNGIMTNNEWQSFLMDKQGRWSLSPAYDMSWAYNPAGAWTSRHQMSVNGKWDDITRQDLIAFAENVNIKQANHIVDQVVEAVSHWSKLARIYGIPQKTSDRIGETLLLSILA